MLIAEKMTGDDTSSLEIVCDGLSFPTSLAIDANGSFYVAESGLPFGGAPPGGRIWRLDRDGSRKLLIENLRAPVNGLTLHEGKLYVSEGGHPARISRFDLDGRKQAVILDNLPGPGNYHTNMVAFSADGKLWRYRLSPQGE
jgi:sugar lactone lactonase YvrE